MDRIAFQDLMAENVCFGCGPDNPQGLRIKSYWEGPETAVCTYQPQPHQTAGSPHYLNGGVIATLIDCHSVCLAVANAYRQDGEDPSATSWFVTASLSVNYLRPTPVDAPLKLKAKILDVEGNKTRLRCSVFSDGHETAVGEVVAGAQFNLFNLVGVVISSNERVALVTRRRGGEILRLVEGQDVDGWRVDAIRPESVTLSAGEVTEVLKLTDAERPKRKTKRAAQQAEEPAAEAAREAEPESDDGGEPEPDTTQ